MLRTVMMRKMYAYLFLAILFACVYKKHIYLLNLAHTHFVIIVIVLKISSISINIFFKSIT